MIRQIKESRGICHVWMSEPIEVVDGEIKAFSGISETLLIEDHGVSTLKIAVLEGEVGLIAVHTRNCNIRLLN